MREKQTHTLFFLKKRTKNHQKEQKRTILYEFFGKARNLTLSRILPTHILSHLLTFLPFYFFTLLLLNRPSCSKKEERNSLIALPFALNGYFYVFLV